MSRSQRMWYLNTYQSHLFNKLLARRIDRLDRMLVGDWAMKMANGACFPVEDAEQEQPRADRFEISPTGILFGSRVSWATGEPGEMEQAVVAEAGTIQEQLVQAAKACGFRGERRSLRVPLNGLEWSVEGSALTLSFALPPGAYATSVLRELMKVGEGLEARGKGIRGKTAPSEIGVVVHECVLSLLSLGIGPGRYLAFL